MKKILVIATLAAVFMMSGTVLSQASVEWKGFHWNAYEAARITENYDGHLEVEPTSYYGGAAHYSTRIDFRSAKTPWIEATFLDDLQKRGIQLVIKNDYREYTHIGASVSHKNYVIYWYDYKSRSGGLVDTSIIRTSGQHTLKLGMRENGTVDYWIDDVRVWNTNNINPESFEDIYLAAQASTGTFIDYQVGIDYRAPKSAVDISIDIKPGVNPNNINLKSKGVVPVAILTTETFDATTVDPLSVEFGPDAATETHGKGHIEDVDEDGDLDLLLHFKTQELKLDKNSTEATLTLTGITYDGHAIIGRDRVNIVPKGK